MTEVRSRDLLRLAAPLIATNAIQSLLSLTDLWFLGRLSTDAVAALGAIFWIVICLATVLSGVSFVVQSFVSQAVGARRRARASQAAWTGLWAALLAVPLTTALALLGRPLIDALGLQPTTAALAWEFWAPRVLGLPLGLAVWAITSFYNGTGQTLRTLGIAGLAIAANLPLNQWFIFEFGWGMAGAAWATNAAQLLALGAGLAVFLGRQTRRRFFSAVTWRLHWPLLWRMWQVGMPVGVMYGADLIGIAVFQLMIAQASVPGAAATQIIITITSLAYQPAIGIATAGTTFVGQAIGAGRYELARRYGNRAIALCVAWMGCAAVFLLLAGAAIARFFLGADDAAAQAALAIALQILWPAAAYQVFDGLYFGAGFALRAAGDTRVPAVAALVLSWFVFVPLAHALIFTPQQAWFGGLPQFGWGAFGGWIALMSYAIVLGSLIFVRWRLGAWRRLVRL